MGPEAVDPPTLYLTSLKLIDRIAAALCRRNGIRGADAEDFASEVRLKLLQDDYAILRRHRGLSSITRYLKVVITNVLRDYRTRLWGKWRPTLAARRLGETAMLLEMAMHRDGLSFDQACEVLTRNGQVREGRAELRRILSQLPRRAARREEDESDPDEMPAPRSADDLVLEGERAGKRRAARQVLQRALGRLGYEDRVILKMRYQEGLSIADIARGLRLPQKPLYARIERLHRTLAAALAEEGIGPEILDEMEGWDASDDDDSPDDDTPDKDSLDGGNAGRRPSPL